MRFRITTTHVTILILITAGYLSLTNLDLTYFWDDEAFVGIMAKNFLNTGELTAWDGRNLAAYVNGNELTNDLISINPPLDNLVAAVSFWIFGATTWAGRFPFVLFGLASIIVFSLLLRQHTEKDPWLWFYVLGSYAYSLGFLMNVRQCRYYALALFFSLLTLFLYHQCLRRKKVLYYILLAVSSGFLFYSNFLLTFAFLCSLILLHLLFYRNQLQQNDWFKVGLAIAIFALLTAPYAYYIRIWAHPDYSGIGGISLILQNFWYQNALGRLPWPVVPALVYFMIRSRRTGDQKIRLILQWVVLSASNVLVISLLSNYSGFFVEHYLILSLPFLAGLTGICIRYLHQRNSIIAIAVFIAILTTNIMSAAPLGSKIPYSQRPGIHDLRNRNPYEWQFEWRLPAYLHEIYNKYPTAEESVARFLDRYASQDDLVYSPTPSRLISLMFYKGEKIKICCLLENGTPLPRDKLANLKAPLFYEENFPNWLIVYGYFPAAKAMLHYFSRPHQEGEVTTRYYYRHVSTPNIFWYYSHRPELAVHRFGPHAEFDSSKGEAVYIFQRFPKAGDESH